jgi:hypothetical protein
MRRVKFTIPMLLFACACNASSVVTPTAAGEGPSTSAAAESALEASAPTDAGTEGGDGGIMIGSGTGRGAGGIMMGSGG